MSSEGISTKILMWLLGIIAALLIAGVGATINFWLEWKEDEAIEEQQAKAVMFDDAGQKQTTLNHVEQSLSPEDQKIKVLRDSDFQERILKEIRHIDSINKLNADQMYQIKEEIKNIH